MDTKEVLNNLATICKNNKFTLEEHEYLQKGILVIQEKLDELDKLKAVEKKD